MHPSDDRNVVPFPSDQLLTVSTARARVGAGDDAPGRQPALHNRLLRALPPQELARIQPRLEPFAIVPLELLADLGEPIRHVYFPETGIISLLSRAANGTLIENGTVGYEGMAGYPLAMGVEWTPAVILGEVPGASWRLDAATFRELLPTLPTLEALLRRYVVYVVSQVSQSLACNSLHPLEQRCARWLLTTHDRVGGDQFALTHEVLSQMLAVRRAGVTEAAGALQRAGLIIYRRGKVSVVDRAGLERAACECYGIVRDHHDRLLGSLGG
jgi:CRP-like cAMP-binding protein